MKRFEIALAGFFVANWVVGALAWFGLLSVSGNLPIGLYTFFSTAAALGWVCGNVWVARTRVVGFLRGRLLLVLYYLGPTGTLYLLRAMQSRDAQLAAPFSPLYAFFVMTIFFLVPVLLRRTKSDPLRFGDRGTRDRNRAVPEFRERDPDARDHDPEGEG